MDLLSKKLLINKAAVSGFVLYRLVAGRLNQHRYPRILNDPKLLESSKF